MSSTDMKSNIPVYVYVAAVLVAVAITGSYFYPKSTSQTVVQQTAGTSPAGSTFGTAKYAAVAVSLSSSGANGTSTTIVNTDSNDRYVTGPVVTCQGVGTATNSGPDGKGVANLKLQIGTTSASAPASFVSFAPVTGSGIVISTSSQSYQIASSTTQTATSTLAVRWPSGTGITFFWNATDTASCTEGVTYTGS